MDMAARSIWSEVGFAKTLLQAAGFKMLPSRRVVGAMRVQLGLAKGFPRPGVDANGQPAVIAELPASERFYAGGGSTVRGFPLDSLGVPSIIDSNGLSIGGNGVLIINAELRIKVAKLFKRDFGIVPFTDAGNVFAKASEINLRQVRNSVGVGFRYNSPLGPIRLDLGFKVGRRIVGGQLESAWAWHLSIGEAF
jgi:outer membrane protein insertion porin family